MLNFVKFALFASVTGAIAQSSGTASDTMLVTASSTDVVASQGASTAAGPLPTSGITPCIIKCLQSSKKCPDITNLDCVCKSREFQSAVGECIEKDCPADLPQALGLQQAQCSGSSATPFSGSPSSGRPFSTQKPTSSGASPSIRSVSSSPPASAAAFSTCQVSGTATACPNSAVGATAFGGVWALAAALLGLVAGL